MPDREAVRRAAGKLKLVDISYKSISAELSDAFSPHVNMPKQCRFQTLDLHPIAMQTFDIEGTERRLVQFHIAGGVRLLDTEIEDLTDVPDEQVEKMVVATIQATMIASFRQEDRAAVTNEEYSAFAGTNAPFLTFPFWREMVLSACARLGVPRTILPMYRLSQNEVKLDEQTVTEERIRVTR